MLLRTLILLSAHGACFVYFYISIENIFIQHLALFHYQCGCGSVYRESLGQGVVYATDDGESSDGITSTSLLKVSLA